MLWFAGGADYGCGDGVWNGETHEIRRSYCATPAIISPICSTVASPRFTTPMMRPS